MSRRLRFTGEWPTAELWRQYPNWENALGEEREPGQDETTLRPSEAQDKITLDVTFTAAKARLAGGIELPAILELNAFEVYGLDVLSGDRDGWRLYLDANDRWTPFEQSWLPKSERMSTVALLDGNVFPLRVTSVLVSASTGRRYVFTINPNGTSAAT